MRNYSNLGKIKPFLKQCWPFGSLAIGGCLVLKPILTVLTIIAAVTFFCIFLFPQIIIPFLLIIRSSLDIFTDIGFYIGPMLINIPSITSLFIIFGGGPYILFNMALKKRIIADRVGKTFLFWLILLLLWVLRAYLNFGMEGLIALREWVRLVSLFTIYMLVYSLTKQIGYKRAISYFFWALPVPLIAGIYQFFTKTGIKAGGINRISGTLAHPNPFALFLVLFIGLTLWKIRTERHRSFWFLLLGIECFVLINTFSISGMVMLLLMLAVLAFKTLKTKYRLTIFILAVTIAISFSLSDYGKKRLEEISRTGSFQKIAETGRISGGGSLAWRIWNWRLFMKEWEDKPVLGHGLRATGELISPLKNEVHNDYLRFLVETGLIGFFLYLFFLGVLGREIWKLYCVSSARDMKFSYLVLVNFSIYAAWIAGSFADNYLTATTFQYYFWGLTGALMANNQPDGFKKGAV